MNPSLDPRVTQLAIQDDGTTTIVQDGENWNAFAVFHQEKRGKHHEHVGIVHAPNAELALIFAKEQYARRKRCVNMWVVKCTDILAFDTKDEDIFESAIWPEKNYRDASGFKVMEKINKYKQEGKLKA
jgi:ring-1,2-phenylacetyl-CoA epoxidase subunit PaaB